MTLLATRLTGGPTLQGAFGIDSLPLTTVARIIAYLDDDPTALARLCRTSRVLHYMTLPHLWKAVSLRTYSTVKYRDDVPEGFGSASPFSMGLNALVTRSVATLVQSLTLAGEFRTADLDECARIGRVSEAAMILNIAVRAAIDQCSNLNSVRWDLNVRIQPTLFTGLAKLAHLESLWLRFPTTKSAQPSVEVPQLPNIRHLTVSHYDPLCFPYDLSSLLLHAHKLETMNMHYSPRMREQAESSVVVTHLFRKNIAARKKLRLRKLGLYNLLAGQDVFECAQAIDASALQEFTGLNTFGVDEDTVASDTRGAHFIDQIWLTQSTKQSSEHPRFTSLRIDQLHKRHAQDLANLAGLERLYLINARHKPDTTNGYSTPDSAPPALSPATSSAIRSTRGTPQPNHSLRDLYLGNICGVCGPTLQHLILPARWCLSTSLAARLIRSCPQLTQLSAAIVYDNFETMRVLVPFLTKLYAIRVFTPPCDGDLAAERLAAHEAFVEQPDDLHEEKMMGALAHGKSTPQSDFPSLRYVGLGRKVWEIGGTFQETIHTPSEEAAVDSEEVNQAGHRGEIVYRRRVKRIQEKDVQHIEIWHMDSMDIV